ncbi:hypothetical protein QEN19_002485 [Hanseniaspora menglaensis]
MTTTTEAQEHELTMMLYPEGNDGFFSLTKLCDELLISKKYQEKLEINPKCIKQIDDKQLLNLIANHIYSSSIDKNIDCEDAINYETNMTLGPLIKKRKLDIENSDKLDLNFMLSSQNKTITETNILNSVALKNENSYFELLKSRSEEVESCSSIEILESKLENSTYQRSQNYSEISLLTSFINNGSVSDIENFT